MDKNINIDHKLIEYIFSHTSNLHPIQRELIKFNENLSPIAVLGDSVSMGWGVDDNQTFSSILERNLKRKV